MKLFNHLNLQVHNVPMACFSREEFKILVRIIMVLPILDQSRSWLNFSHCFKLLDVTNNSSSSNNNINDNKNTNAPRFNYYILGSVSCTLNGRTHLIFTIRCNYYLHFTNEGTEPQSS